MSVPGADPRFTVKARVPVVGDPTAPGANDQVWLFRRPLEWAEHDGPKRARAMVLQTARWIAERAVEEGKGAIIPEGEGKRLLSAQERGEEPSYGGPAVEAPALQPEAPGRLDDLEARVVSQDAKLDLILSLLAAKGE